MRTFNSSNAESQKGKIYKLFGRKLLQWTNVWNNIKEKVMSENNDDIDSKILIYFLDSFSHSIHNQEQEIDKQIGHDDNDYLRDDQELIWCSNFNALLVKRQQNRRIVAQQRLIEQQEYHVRNDDSDNDDDDNI